MTVTTRYIRGLESRVRAKRIGLVQEEGLVVESKTLGSTLAFNLPTENLSRTGLLLNGGRYKAVPFIVNTLLEMTVDPRGKMLERPVTCIGKIVRIDSETSDAIRYGVQIVQMETKDEDLWMRCVLAMEKERLVEKEPENLLPAA